MILSCMRVLFCFAVRDIMLVQNCARLFVENGFSLSKAVRVIFDSNYEKQNQEIER